MKTDSTYRALSPRMHRRNAWTKEVSIPSATNEGRNVVEEVLAEARRRNWPEGDLFGVHLAVEEALVNAIKHGNRLEADKQVQIRCFITDNELSVEITDEGDGFDPMNLPDPTLDENLECPSGRGVMLMRSFMDDVEFNSKGNAVCMRKRRSTEDDESQSDD